MIVLVGHVINKGLHKYWFFVVAPVVTLHVCSGELLCSIHFSEVFPVDGHPVLSRPAAGAEVNMRDILLYGGIPGAAASRTLRRPLDGAGPLYSATMQAMEMGLFPYSSTAHDAASKIARCWRALIRRRRRAVTLFQVRLHVFPVVELGEIEWNHAC